MNIHQFNILAMEHWVQSQVTSLEICRRKRDTEKDVSTAESEGF
jgi:hypothetical protein